MWPERVVNVFIIFLLSIDFAFPNNSVRIYSVVLQYCWISSQCVKNNWTLVSFQFLRSSIGPTKLFILSNYICYNIFYILSVWQEQKLPFSFIITLLCILVCFSMTTMSARSSGVFTFALITILYELPYSWYLAEQPGHAKARSNMH